MIKVVRSNRSSSLLFFLVSIFLVLFTCFLLNLLTKKFYQKQKQNNYKKYDAQKDQILIPLISMESVNLIQINKQKKYIIEAKSDIVNLIKNTSQIICYKVAAVVTDNEKQQAIIIADYATFYQNDKKINLTSKIKILYDKNELEGNNFVYDLENKIIKSLSQFTIKNDMLSFEANEGYVNISTGKLSLNDKVKTTIKLHDIQQQP